MLQSLPLMIRSMTGYGAGSAEASGLKVAVELRSVNNRFADIKLRLPDELVPDEPGLRRRIGETVRRGRVDCEIRLEREGRAAAPIVLNRAAVEAALAAFKTLREDYGVVGEWDLAAVLRVPGVLETVRGGTPLDDGDRATLGTALDAALAALDAERAREGRRLQEDLVARVDTMSALVGAIRERAAHIPEALRTRTHERVQALLSQIPVDPARLAQEVAFLADRGDLTEEVVRLQGHLDQGRALLAEPDGEPVGKRLDFLLQEIHRETNTIASKSQDLDISRQALALKAEAERIREQAQNLE